MPAKTTPSPCFVGGEQAINSNARIAQQILDTDDFKSVSGLIDEIAEGLKQSKPAFSQENAGQMFAEAAERMKLHGDDPSSLYQAMRNFDFETTGAIESIQDVIFKQQAAYNVMDNILNTEALSVATRIEKAVLEGKPTKELELEQVAIKAKLQNLFAYTSVLGTGLSRAFSHRKSKNILKELRSFQESVAKKFDEEGTFTGERFIQKHKPNKNVKRNTQLEIKHLDEDTKQGVKGLNDEALDDRIKVDDDNVKLEKTKIKGLKEELKKATEDPANKTKVEVEAETQAKVKEQEAKIENLKKLKEAKKKESELRGGKTDKQIDQELAKAREDLKQTKKLAKLQRQRQKQSGGRSPEEIQKEINAAEAEVKNIQKITRLRKRLKKVRAENGNIEKVTKDLEAALAERFPKAKDKLKNAEIETQKLHDEFSKQLLGTEDGRTYAKRFLVAHKAGKADTFIHTVNKMNKESGWTKGLNMSLQAYMGNLLSGPPSFVLNGMVPVFSHMLQRFERATGGLLMGNMDVLKASLSMNNTFTSVKESLTLGGAALKADTDVYTGGTRAYDEKGSSGAFDPESFDADTKLGRIVQTEPVSMIMSTINWLTRLPFRINGSADVINKVISSRKYLNDHFMLEAYNLARKGSIASDTASIAKYVDKKIRAMHNADGSLFSQKRMVEGYTRKALEEGADITDPIAFAKKRDEYINKHLEDAGMDLGEMDTLARKAEAAARESTFTGEPGYLTTKLNELREHYPFMKFFLPFLNTPMQVLHFGWRRTLPGVAFEKLAPKLMKSADEAKLEWAQLGPLEQAAQRGRYVTATATTGALIYYATGNRDRITGGGPRNPDEKKALESTGWRPYSFVTINDDGTKTYTSYQRLDPFATMIGLVADIAEFTEMNPDQEPHSAEAFSAMAFTVAKNMTDKSFLRGLNNMLNIFSDPDTYIPKTFRDVASAMAVPMFVDKIKGYEAEQLIRENRNISDAILRKLPIAEERVPPKRTFLGEAVYKQNPLGVAGVFNPIYVSSKKNDIVDEKIQSMLYGFSMPSANWLNHSSTDMREFYDSNNRQAYDRFLELSGTVKINNRDLRSSLKMLFKSKPYQAAEQNYLLAIQNGAEDIEDPRVRYTKQIISRYRRLAKQQVLTEFPELEQAVRQIKYNNKLLRSGQQLTNPIPSL